MMPRQHADPTPLPEPLEAALVRTRAALTRLRAAAERSLDGRAARTDHDHELALMQEDRIRLAHDLDEARARAETLRAAQGEALTRLARAEAAVAVAMRDLLVEEASFAEPEVERAG